MEVKITTLPEDIIKNVNKQNWERVFDEHMVFETALHLKRKEKNLHECEYVWTPDVMKDFIKAILKK